MLEQLPVERVRTRLVRFAVRRNSEQAREFFENQRIDARSADETIQFLEAQGITPRSDVGQVFDSKPRSVRSVRTRFSDGSFPVLYASKEAQTAKAEIMHSFGRRFSGRPAGMRRVWYMRYTFEFVGEVKDLRPKLAEWPALIHDSDYGFCNKLGSEAKAAALHGLLAPSARNEGGTNLPIFVKTTVDKFSEGKLVEVAYNPQSGKASLFEA